MSTNLFWRPESDGNLLGYDLKFPLRRYLGVGVVDHATLGDEMLPWLHGVIDSNECRGDLVAQAKELIKLIEKHGSVVVVGAVLMFDLGRVLEWVNGERERRGLPPLDRIPKGVHCAPQMPPGLGVG